MSRIDRATVIGSISAAALFVCTAFIGAQAPAAPQGATPPAQQGAAPPAAPGGRGAPGTESGWATFQGQCFRCHGNTVHNKGTDRVGDPADDAGAHLRRR